MKRYFSKRANARKLLVFVLLPALILSMLCGCGQKMSDTAKYYSKSEKAVAAFEDAMYILNRCLEEKMSPKECGDELEAIASSYERYSEEDAILGNAVLFISISGSAIKTAELRHRLGTESMAGVMREVREARDDIAGKLK